MSAYIASLTAQIKEINNNQPKEIRSKCCYYREYELCLVDQLIETERQH